MYERLEQVKRLSDIHTIFHKHDDIVFNWYSKLVTTSLTYEGEKHPAIVQYHGVNNLLHQLGRKMSRPLPILNKAGDLIQTVFVPIFCSGSVDSIEPTVYNFYNNDVKADCKLQIEEILYVEADLFFIIVSIDLVYDRAHHDNLYSLNFEGLLHD